ncbi:MAG: hypothetical protein NC184_05300 [Roseburia sp.]|nr:hypothetical protein [Roseburia sp.]
MPYLESKVYYDGSHYIAIPHTEPQPRKYKRRMNIADLTPIKQSSEDDKFSGLMPVQRKDGKLPLEVLAEQPKEQAPDKPKITTNSKTKGELFDELYKKYLHLKSKAREEQILADMRVFFPKDKKLEEYIKDKLEKKKRNLICRRKRMVRKANLADFNFFCTFTYSNELHTEQSFKKALKKTFANFASRKGWKYMGVWERSPEKQRLHFHGLFEIPNGTIPGILKHKRDYSTISHKMQDTLQSEYFNERFGRNDFKVIDEYDNKLGNAVAYLMKYIEKTGERIVYSKGLYQYFISDITDDDVICPYGEEEKKLILADNFKCHDEGVYIGRVSKSVIAQMRKSN